MSRLANTIEAILYLKGEPLSIAELAEYAGCYRDEAEAATIELMDDYAHRDSALEVVETKKGYSLQLRETYHELVHQLIPAELSLAALRTLAAIALYPGQISQSDLVAIRGSGAYQHVQELMQQGFIKKRRRGDGRTTWLHLTKKFHQYFQIDQLPPTIDN